MSNHSVITERYHMKCVEKHMHKKIDRSEMNKKSYTGPCSCSACMHGWRYVATYISLLDATIDS